MTYTLNGHKYNIYQKGTTLYAVSSYAGRMVRGVAKCDPRDDFDMNKGMELAARRCELKIAKKRAKYHDEYFTLASKALKKMQAIYNTAFIIAQDTEVARMKTEDELNAFMKSL